MPVRFEHANAPRPESFTDIAAWARAMTDFANDLSRRVEDAQLGRASKNVYGITNATGLLTLDVSTATAGEVADFVGSLVADLAAKSIVRTKG